MNPNRNVKHIIGIIIAILIAHTSMFVYAHTHSQSGVLWSGRDKGLGCEKIGWIIGENAHTNGSNITYSFDIYDANLTPTYQTYVRNGAGKWSGILSITEQTYGNCTGIIRTFDDPYENAVAQIISPFHVDNFGHWSSWVMELNLTHANYFDAALFAHEFGHVIGLRDLYLPMNYNKLMCGYVDYRTALNPTTQDQWGAKVITGQHTSHTFRYDYHSTSSPGNYHARYCNSCNGIALPGPEQCTYNPRGICTICGIGQGYHPDVYEEPMQQNEVV